MNSTKIIISLLAMLFFGNVYVNYVFEKKKDFKNLLELRKHHKNTYYLL